MPGDSEEDRRLLNRRLAYFGAVLALLSLAFYVYNAILHAIITRALPSLGRPELLLHAGATSVFGLQWLLCRDGKRSSKQLNAIDIAGVLGGMALFGLMTVAEAMNFENAIAVESARAEALLVALVTLAVVLTRAVIVPGTVRRTLWLSAATAAIGPVAAYVIVVQAYPPELLRQKPWLPTAVSMYIVMWSLLTVTVSTIAARVIYGLQQRVREANEVGQYTLEEKIGEGGMGVVYRARHALLRRPTAVKLLFSRSAGEHAVRRFEREVQLTSSLTHPNTIAIFDFGHTPDGVFYYAMEYLDGITLEDLVDHDGPQPAARVIQILRQAASALEEAHSIGLIHRDIKPANLMLCLRGRVPDQVKVLDFGLVKERDAEESAGLSVAGGLVGTPAYLAPEAIADASRVDARTDLYALGAVAYRLLVGEVVFRGETLLELCAHHLHTAPTPPSLRSDRHIPAALEQLVLSCLAKKPEDRPASAAELITSLDAITDAGAWSRADAQRWWTERAPAVERALRSRRASSADSRRRTVAIDLARRSEASGVRALG